MYLYRVLYIEEGNCIGCNIWLERRFEMCEVYVNQISAGNHLFMSAFGHISTCFQGCFSISTFDVT